MSVYGKSDFHLNYSSFYERNNCNLYPVSASSGRQDFKQKVELLEHFCEHDELLIMRWIDISKMHTNKTICRIKLTDCSNSCMNFQWKRSTFFKLYVWKKIIHDFKHLFCNFIFSLFIYRLCHHHSIMNGFFMFRRYMLCDIRILNTIIVIFPFFFCTF